MQTFPAVRSVNIEHILLKYILLLTIWEDIQQRSRESLCLCTIISDILQYCIAEALQAINLLII